MYGPIHAWRALAQMRAAEAVRPLLDVQDQLDEVGDDWYLEEFPQVFGLIGPPTIVPLEAYLSETAHAEYSLVNAAYGLREIAIRFPEHEAASSPFSPSSWRTIGRRRWNGTLIWSMICWT